MKCFTVFAVVISISPYFDASNGNNWEPCGADWEQYKDEKCFKILDDQPTQSFDNAISTCASLEHTSKLVMIQSLEEQNYLTNYLFKIHKKVDNFWIGSKYNNSNNSFKWLDNSELSYANWDFNYPSSKKSLNPCVQMQADEGVAGKWKNEPCEKRYAVVCQKMQFWSIDRLQKSFLSARNEFSVALSVAQKDIQTLKQRLNDSENELKISKKNPVPIGFIYVQLWNQPEPQTLWSTIQWTDITSDYAGLFFRAEGGGSAKFGTVQDENAPRITKVRYESHDYPGNHGEAWKQTVLSVGNQSSGIGVFSGSFNNVKGYTHRFYQERFVLETLLSRFGNVLNKI